MHKRRIRQPNRSQQTYCKAFSNYNRGSDPNRAWNATECKCTLEALLKGVSTKHATELPMHLNREETRKTHCNTLKNFPLHGFSKHLHWFRCSGKGKHLNLASRQNPAANQLTTNALQEFQQQRPWFRSQPVLEHRRTQMHSGGASCRGIHQTRNRAAHASEPELNPRNSPQHVEKLFIVRFQQASPLVQMQRKREASEPCGKAESGSQTAHNKRIARISATTPMVQIPTHMNR